MKIISLALLCFTYVLLPLEAEIQTDEERLQQVLFYYSNLESYQADVTYSLKSGFVDLASEKYTLYLTPREKRIDTPAAVSISTNIEEAVINLIENLITVMDSDGAYPDKRDFFTFWKKDYEIIEGKYENLKGKIVYLIILKAEKDQEISKVKLYLDGNRIVSMVHIGRDYSVQEYSFSNEKINPVFDKNWFNFYEFKKNPGMTIEDLRDK